MAPVAEFTVRLCLYLTALILASTSSSVAHMACPEAPRAADSELYVNAKGKVSGLGKLATAQIDGAVSSIVKDLYGQYPNADKLIIAQLIVSLTCETLKAQSFTPSEISGILDRLRSDLLKLMINEKNAENKPKVKSYLESDGVFRLVNSGGTINNLEIKMETVINSDLIQEKKEVRDGREVVVRRYLLGDFNGLAARNPGVPFGTRDNEIFSLDVK